MTKRPPAATRSHSSSGHSSMQLPAPWISRIAGSAWSPNVSTQSSTPLASINRRPVTGFIVMPMNLERLHAPPGERIPNNPRFPVLIYHGVEAATEGADAARALFAEHGWGGAWVDGIFPFHHFHSTSHEALAVVAGRAVVELGGSQGQAFEVSAGDVLVLPAGTGHRRASSEPGFTVVGAYPAGQEDYDLLRGDDPAEVEAARERIAALPAPPDDPVGGDGVRGWR
jgi:uncharacterized protein YjlB